MADDFIRQFLNDPAFQEALSWLEESSESDRRTLGELEGTDQSVDLVRDAYRRGALKALAVEIYRWDGGQDTGKLVIELPDDQTGRDQVLAWAGAIAEEQGFDAEPDIGQSHVFVMLD